MHLPEALCINMVSKIGPVIEDNPLRQLTSAIQRFPVNKDSIIAAFYEAGIAGPGFGGADANMVIRVKRMEP